LSWAVGYTSTQNILSSFVPTRATVISSHVDDSDPQDKTASVDVGFTTKSGRIVRTTIQPDPNQFDGALRGQKLPILYDPAAPSDAAYSGPGGDSAYPNLHGWEWPAYYGAAAWLSLALVLFSTGASRFIGITRAALTSVTTPVRLKKTSFEVVVTDQLPDSYGLEWRVLPGQADIADEARILGKPEAGRWLIVRLDNDRLIWPASKAQPLLASAILRRPVVPSGPVGTVHLLLAGYAQMVELLGKLPIVMRQPPGVGINWWIIGALRPVVKSLLTIHLRRRLMALASALLWAASLCDDEPNHQSRRSLVEASNECRAFAETLPRRSLLAVLVTVAATSITIIGPFLLLPHIQFSGQVLGQYALPVLIGVLIFGVAPMLIFFRSVQCKRALFNPASANFNRPLTEPEAGVTADWNVYELERAAFAAVGVPEPNEWEAGRPIRWLVGFFYLAAISIPIGYVAPLITLAILGTSIVVFAIVKTYQWQHRVRTLQGSRDNSRAAP
jgi:hypothetical protein